MPSRNIVKPYLAQSFYHLYNRGVNRRRIFLDEKDYEFFERLFARYLSPRPTLDDRLREYPHLQPDISLNAYCLMPNHFHLLVYQETEQGITKLMQSICTTYTMYFNKRHKRRGPLFESHYKASLIQVDKYLLHISRYIHLNPRQFRAWPHSSLMAYLGGDQPNWLHIAPILELFDSTAQYQKFVLDYEDMQRTLDDIKHELAAL